jgi:hypothetical protein
MVVTMEHTMRHVYYISDEPTKGTVRDRRKTLSELDQTFGEMKSMVSNLLPDQAAKVSVTRCEGRPRVRKLEIESSFANNAIRAALTKYLNAVHLLVTDPPS